MKTKIVVSDLMQKGYVYFFTEPKGKIAIRISDSDSVQRKYWT